MKVSKWSGFLEGAAKIGRFVVFGITLPGVSECDLVLYRAGTEEVISTLHLDESVRFGDAFSFCVEGLSGDRFDYVYRTPSGDVVDPCAAKVSGRERANRSTLSR